MGDIGKVLATAVCAVLVGAFLVWERTLSGPNPVTTVGVVVCAVVAVFSVGTAAICTLYEMGSGTDPVTEKMYTYQHRK